MCPRRYSSTSFANGGTLFFFFTNFKVTSFSRHSVKARAGRPRYVQQMTAKEAENILGDFTWEPEM